MKASQNQVGGLTKPDQGFAPVVALERGHRDDIHHALCFANLLSGDSNSVLFIFVQLRQLVLPSGAASSMWLHVFCESNFFSPQWNWWLFPVRRTNKKPGKLTAFKALRWWGVSDLNRYGKMPRDFPATPCCHGRVSRCSLDYIFFIANDLRRAVYSLYAFRICIRFARGCP